MEALIFLMDAIAIIVLVVTSLRNDKRKPGEPMTGPFRYAETVDRVSAARRPMAHLPQDGT